MPNFAADSVDMTMKKSTLYLIAALIWGIPGIPAEFTASFYSGLGPMLLVAALRFIRNRAS